MIVSFDVFDTALVRSVYKPTDLFDLIELRIGNDFKKKRLQAEQNARKKCITYDIDCIYSFLPEFNKNIEIRFELENCKPNPYFLDRYNTELFDVIFISDMYLSSATIKEMLIKCGYKDPKVFVSCELGEHKATGRLFKKVEKLVGKIDTHYGDNYIADILGARCANITAKYTTSLENMKHNIPDISSTQLKKLLVENEMSSKSLNQKVACYFTPMIYSFTKWILDNRNGKKIFFNARDGYVPYIIARDIFKAKDIYYIECSRKSVLPCSIDFTKDLDAEENKTHFTRLVLTRAGDIPAFLDAIGYNEDRMFLANRDTYTIKDFVKANQTALYRFFKQKKDNAKAYLSKYDIQDGDILVDIGYYGSIQYSIEKILNKKMQGFYLQTFKSDLDDLERYSYFDKRIVKYCLLVESLLSSAEDGVNGYTSLGEPIHYADNKSKKNFSKEIVDEILNTAMVIQRDNITLNRADIERLVIRFLYYPTLEESNYCNDPIFENGDISKFESCVWYDREEIKAGRLQDCYDKSYWRPAFLTQLRNDKELSSLEKHLIVREWH
jgi:predicted HAD superfamily hydrolase